MQLRAVHGGVRALTAIGELAGVVQGWITASQGQISRGLAKHLGSRMWAALLCLGWPWVALGGPWAALGSLRWASGGLWRALVGWGLSWAGCGRPRRVQVGRRCLSRKAPSAGPREIPGTQVDRRHPPSSTIQPSIVRQPLHRRWPCPKTSSPARRARS